MMYSHLRLVKPLNKREKEKAVSKMIRLSITTILCALSWALLFYWGNKELILKEDSTMFSSVLIFFSLMAIIIAFVADIIFNPSDPSILRKEISLGFGLVFIASITERIGFGLMPILLPLITLVIYMISRFSINLHRDLKKTS